MALRRRFPLVLFLITLLAAALQFSALAAQSLWYDEGFSVWLAQQSPRAIVEVTAADIQPPLYYLLLSGWIHLTGHSEYTLRFLSALFAVLCVPLVWQVARRLTGQPVAGPFAAVIVALSPLWLWYGREVRNYALLLALLLACAYTLLRFLQEPSPDRRTPFTIAALITVGLYTHYFMIFVVAAWGLVVGLYALIRPKVLLPVLAAFGLPIVLYAPWLGIMVTRLGEDRSYWEGELNVTDALAKTLASWMAGHTMPEATAIQWGVVGLAVAVMGVGKLLWQGVKESTKQKAAKDPAPGSAFRFPLSGLFIAAWWLIPVTLYLAVAFNRPKFNARYLIFSAPAFWLAIVVLLVWLWRKNKIVGGLLLAILLTSQLQATYNLYTDPAFAKANWRDVAAYIQANRRPDERVMLVSGHAFPMTEYYLPGVEILPFPPERTLDTTAVLGVDNTALTLAEGLQGSAGVWLINWQDEVIDPEGVIPAWITMTGATEEKVPLFQEVRLSHWNFGADTTFEPIYTPQNPLDVRFEDSLTLKGWSGLPAPNPADKGLAVQLFWAAQRPLEGDYKMRLRVVDEQGFEYGVLDQRPTAYNLPTFRWQPDDLRLADLRVPLVVGTPPGNYWVELSVYREGSTENLNILDAANAPQGQSTRMGPIPLVAPTNGWLVGGETIVGTRPVDQPLMGEWIVKSVSPLPDRVDAGQRFDLYLWLLADPDHPLMEVALEWQNGASRIAGSSRQLENDGWQAGGIILVPLRVQAPLEAGSWNLAVKVVDSEGATVTVPLSEIGIIASDRTFTPPTPVVSQVATFADSIRLLGYDLAVINDKQAQVTLYWESLLPLNQSYTTFVHLLDANGVIVPDAGQDKVPLDGARPTEGWVEGEYLSDTFTLTVPVEGYATPYQIEIGWYDAQDPTFPRLPTTGEGSDGNRVLLKDRLP